MSRKAKSKKQRGKKRKQVAKKGISQKHIYIALGIIAAVVFIAYLPVLGAGFVDIDDKKLILDRKWQYLNQPWYAFEYCWGVPHYKPMTYLSWALEYRTVRDQPFLYHFDNLLLHIANSLLVFSLVRSLSKQFKRLKGQEFYIALFSALIFGLHPLHVESVAWVVERKDVLYTLFYLLSILGYIRYLEKGKTLPLALSAVAYWCSAMSKAPGITLPAILVLLDLVWQRKWSWKLVYEKAGHIGVLLFTLYAFGVFTRSHGEGSVAAILDEKKLARASNVAEVPSLYGKAVLAGMRGTLWYVHSLLPFKTSIAYPREAIIGFFGFFINAFPFLLAGAAAVLLKFRKRYPLLFFGHAFFFITLAPAIARLGLGIGIFMSDRYVYLSLFGLIFWLVSIVVTLNEEGVFKPKVKRGLLVGVCLLFAALTYNNARNWKSTETLWTNAINKFPNVAYPYVNRGSFYREMGEYQKAIDDASKSIELDDNANARVQRGLALRQMGRPQEAIVDYDRAIELEPKNTQAHINRGNARLDAGLFRKAIEDYDVAIEREPRHQKALVNRAIAYASLRKYNKALENFSLAEAAGRNYKDLYVNRAILYVEMGQNENALADYMKYISFEPNDHQIWNDMGIVHQFINQHEQAIQKLSQAIAIKPEKDYYRVRANSYEALGRQAEAQRDRQMAQ